MKYLHVIDEQLVAELIACGNYPIAHYEADVHSVQVFAIDDEKVSVFNADDNVSKCFVSERLVMFL